MTPRLAGRGALHSQVAVIWAPGPLACRVTPSRVVVMFQERKVPPVSRSAPSSDAVIPQEMTKGPDPDDAPKEKSTPAAHATAAIAVAADHHRGLKGASQERGGPGSTNESPPEANQRCRRGRRVSSTTVVMMLSANVLRVPEGA